jgi:hypothetical protein
MGNWERNWVILPSSASLPLPLEIVACECSGFAPGVASLVEIDRALVRQVVCPLSLSAVAIVPRLDRWYKPLVLPRRLSEARYEKGD